MNIGPVKKKPTDSKKGPIYIKNVYKHLSTYCINKCMHCDMRNVYKHPSGHINVESMIEITVDIRFRMQIELESVCKLQTVLYFDTGVGPTCKLIRKMNPKSWGHSIMPAAQPHTPLIPKP